MYTIINNSLNEMYNSYSEASDYDKEMILISFKGYSDNIMNNEAYQNTDPNINSLVTSLLQKHNKAL